MIKVNIIGDKYKLPTHPSELSFEEFISINTYISQQKEILYQNKLEILSLIMKCPLESLKLIEENNIDDLYDAIDYLHRSVQLIGLTNFKIKGQLYTLKNLDELTVQEYCDIDFLFKDGDTVYENLDKIFGTLIRKVKTRNKTLENIFRNILLSLKKDKIKYVITEVLEHEEYNEEKVKEYSDLVFDNFNAAHSIVLLNAITEYRDNIVKNYKLVFTVEIKEDEYEEPTEVKSVSEIWGLYNTISNICENDKQKIDYWMKRPIKELFTHLSYLKQYNLENQKR